MCSALVPERTIDVRHITAPMRHSLIFDTFERLTPGEGFQIVNDHDPWPLFSRFHVAHPGELGWDYREEGPDVWRVRVCRTAL